MTIKTHLIKTVAAFLVMLALSCAAAMPALADSSQQLQGEAYALYDASQHSLTFKRGDVPACSSGQQVFTGFENESYSLNTTPWAKVARTIGTVSFEDTVRPKSTAYWFTGFRNAVSFDLAKLDTSQVTDMSAMFKTCVHLNSVDVTGFDTSKVTNMESMFDGSTTKAGKVTAPITGNGIYKGSQTITYKITPTKGKITSLKAGKKSFTAKWSDTGATKFKVSYKVKNASKWSTKTFTKRSATVKGLKSGKTYQVKVTSVTTAGNTTTAVKTVKVK